MIDKGKQKKEQQLGMPWTTAGTRLDRLIIFWLAQDCGKATCHRCGKPILKQEEFSVEHKQAWLDVNPALYWDRENIAFSHIACNKRAGRKIGRFAGKITPNRTIAAVKAGEESRDTIEQHTGERPGGGQPLTIRGQ